MKLSPEELAAIIEQTGGALEDLKMEEEKAEQENDDDDSNEYEDIDEQEEVSNGVANGASGGDKQLSADDADIVKEFDLDNYDDEGMSEFLYLMPGTSILFSLFLQKTKETVD